MSTIEFGLGTLPYLLFQFMPVILFGMFALMSLFGQDVRILVYSAGLLLASIIAVIAGQIDALKYDSTCRKSFSLIDSPTALLSPVFSLALVMYSYTFFYLFVPMAMKSAIRENVGVVVFLVLLTAAELLWSFSCHGDLAKGLIADFGAVLGGGAIGIGWAFTVLSTKKDNLLYLVGMGTRATCSAPSSQRFVCKYRDRSATGSSVSSAKSKLKNKNK